ncbi:Hsp33 family molecular chaperone HslO [Aquabacterium sp. OR-4]|uniref:Hsp33 family molecular chaperone HslO n=1 Tax=Aquabacterium sp. OR-4 TaxID=2978127 RepID=UPI0021B3523B|nr:Hsp33 family molecular chaperone HslO [Aquabacterium sp. OR-4]MDT7836199.1 Hsp33 family molecular chaperone HslO [Aquabacterium sp. OR-4]
MDQLIKFMFEGLPVRGMLVRLTGSWREAMARRASASDGGHAFAPEVRQMLGEMAAAGVLMQSNLKFNGALVLQVQGDGPVKLAVAETRSDLGYRVTAKVNGAVPAGAGLAALVNVQGQGRCAITLDPQDRLPGQQPYQGVVPLHGDQREPLQKLSEVLEHYMLQSEQLDTRLVLAANDEVAAGLLIQRLPITGGVMSASGVAYNPDEAHIGANEDFQRIAMLAATLTSQELLTLAPQQVLHCLFWEETLRVFEPLTPRFACTCSRERVAGMLNGLGVDEVRSIIAERGEVEVGCDFCGVQYRFDAVDVGELFTPGRESPPSSSSVQ